jgi:hypothetical protein
MSERSDNAVRGFGYREPRVCAEFPLQLQTDEVEPRWVEARCLDISEDGMAVHCEAQMTVGARIVLLITFPGTPRPVGLFASIASERDGDYGLTFLYSSQIDRDAVKSFLASLGLEVLPVRRAP